MCVLLFGETDKRGPRAKGGGVMVQIEVLVFIVGGK